MMAHKSMFLVTVFFCLSYGYNTNTASGSSQLTGQVSHDSKTTISTSTEPPSTKKSENTSTTRDDSEKGSTREKYSRKLSVEFEQLVELVPNITTVKISSLITLDSHTEITARKGASNISEDVVVQSSIKIPVNLNETLIKEINSAEINQTTEVSSLDSTKEADTTCNSPSVPICPACPVCPLPALPTPTTRPESSAAPAKEVCKTSQCFATAARMLSLMDMTVDPCEDFYSYACGGIFDSPTLLEDDPAVDVWYRIEKAVKDVSAHSPVSHQKLKNYFEGCVHYETLVSLEERKRQGREILESIPTFVNYSSEPENDITDLLIKLFQHGSAPLFGLHLDVDSANSSRFQMVISIPDWQSSLFLTPAEKSYRCRHKPSDQIPQDLLRAYDAYRDCLANLTEFFEVTRKALEFFEVFSNLSEYDTSHMIQEIWMSIEFYILDLLRALPPPSDVQKEFQEKNYKLIPLDQLEILIPQVSWTYLFSALLEDTVLDATTHVQVYFLDDIRNFFFELQKKSERFLYNSLLAIFAHDLYNDIVKTHSPCDRERYCLQVAANLMPAVMSNIYLETFPADTDRELRLQVNLVYQQLKTTMEAKLSEAIWFDTKTLNQLERKLKLMSIELPDMFSDSFLNYSLGKCSLDQKQYVKDSVCLLRQYQTLLYSRYALDPHSAEVIWSHFLSSFSTEPAFIYGLNTFMIPLSIITPVYDKQMPRHVVVAKLGNILAQGIGDNFSNTGIKFDAGGKLGTVFSEEAFPSYESVVYTSNMQYSFSKSHKEKGRVYTYQLNPDLTLNKRLSDITATNLSLSAVQHVNDTLLPWVPFTSKQVYFIVSAQTSCSKKKIPEIYTTLYEGTTLLPFDRVANLATNSEQFALAFKCPVGANMNFISEMKVRPFPMFEKDDMFLMSAL